MLPPRADAWDLLTEWVARIAAAPLPGGRDGDARRGARRNGDEELWGITGLLHDLDYERHPDLETGHPRMAVAELTRLGYPDELVRAVASHADFMGVPRESDMERALAAVDELCGFILACAYVRPQGIQGLTPKSVKKKLASRASRRRSIAADITATAARRSASSSTSSPPR